MEVFVVTAWRWGQRENHSYLVGVYSTNDKAIESAEKHATYRGGKYECTVEKCPLDKDVSEENTITYKAQTSYGRIDKTLEPK